MRLWREYAQLRSPTLADILHSLLVNIADYRKSERISACGTDPVQVLVAYAQNNLIYREGRITAADAAFYRTISEDEKVNKFGLAYRAGAPLLLHRALADIVIDAAMDMHRRHGWITWVFDGLRTVEGAYLMHHNTGFRWLENGLLAAPGQSAHNRALAVDSMVFDGHGHEIDMGAHFDHSDMEINHRNYVGSAISAEAKRNRILKEQAFQRAAIRHGLALAPLRAEFWDDRMPGTEVDLWRVIESLARCTGQVMPGEKAQDYETFAAHWKALNARNALVETFGERAAEPPAYTQIIFHEKLNPIYDRDLPEAFRQARMDVATLSLSSGTA